MKQSNSDRAPDFAQKRPNIVKFPKEETDPNFHRFKFEGKKYKLYKESKTREGNWYIHFQKAGKRIRRSLETNVAKAAEKRAISGLIIPAKGARWDEIKTSRLEKPAETVGRVLEEYRERGFVHQVKPKSGRANIAMLRLVLLTATRKSEIDGLKLTALDGKIIRMFKTNLLEDRLKSSGELSIDEVKRKTSITGNSMLSQARSVFSKVMLRTYNDAGLTVPASIDEFMKEPGFKRVRIEYTPPTQEIIDRTFEEIEKLVESDPNLYKAFWCAVGCGLRKSEIISGRWECFARRDDQVWYVSKDLGKDGRPIEVPVMDDAWKKLSRFGETSGPILVGGYKEIRRSVWMRVGEWMGGLGWKTEKRIHELRAWIGSQIAREHGLTMASLFLRHKDVQTTQKHYSRYLKMSEINVRIGKP